MVLTKKDFEPLGLPDLLINIWSYGKCPKDDLIIKQHVKWNIEVAAQKYFPEAIVNIYKNDRSHFDFRQFSSQEKDLIFYLLIKEI